MPVHTVPSEISTRCCWRIYLGVVVLGVCEVFFLCELGMFDYNDVALYILKVG